MFEKGGFGVIPKQVHAAKRPDTLKRLRVDGSWYCWGNGGAIATAFSPNLCNNDGEDDPEHAAAGLLEVVSLDSLSVKHLVLPQTPQSVGEPAVGQLHDPVVGTAELPVDRETDTTEFFTLQRSGVVRQWQLDAVQTSQELAVWREMFGVAAPIEGTTNPVDGKHQRLKFVPKTC